ncbi:MAG TPA: DUF3137 domain-containing protein [Saprospiraceae bacterium]|nr:DUF3137 domain-containing protein [Saprospiraceae bacterium]
METRDPLAQFRVYYNHTIYPELRRLERLRRRLLGLLVASGFLLAGILVFELFLNIWLVTLILMIPTTLFVFYLGYRIRRFILTFKPQVMQLVLEFLEGLPNITELAYEAKGGIDKPEFMESELFITPAPIYEKEDFIYGKVGEMSFRLCELNVRELSKVRNRTNYVFKGVFMHATFMEETEGRILVWPREFKQYLSQSIRNFTFQGGTNVDHEIMNPEFREIFMTYALPDTHVISILSRPMQDAVVEYYKLTGKEIYMSFHDEEIYIAVTEPKDILEPYILRPNTSFELVREFFEDIHLLLNIVEDFDQTH